MAVRRLGPDSKVRALIQKARQRNEQAILAFAGGGAGLRAPARVAEIRFDFSKGCSADGSGLVCYNSFRRSGVTELWIEVSLAVHMLFINLWLIRWKSLKQAKIGKKERQQNQGFPTNPMKISWGRSSVG
jgi:hypothetical protein